MARASEHFGATVLYVELENSGGPGIQGVLLEVSPIGCRPRAASNMHPDGRDASPTSSCTLLFLLVFVLTCSYAFQDRIYYGELMTFPTPGKRLYRSAVSMGLLQDTGWYVHR